MRVKNLTEKKLLYEAQLKSQQDETKEARVNLAEADEEIQHIIEKKRFNKRFRQSHVQLETKR